MNTFLQMHACLDNVCILKHAYDLKLICSQYYNTYALLTWYANLYLYAFLKQMHAFLDMHTFVKQKSMHSKNKISDCTWNAGQKVPKRVPNPILNGINS